MSVGSNTGAARVRRHDRVRKQVCGTADRPRLCVFRSLKHIYAQVVNDDSGSTLISASALDADIKSDSANKSKKEVAELVGALIAKRALDKGIERVVFDRGGYKYHGRVRSLAEGARAAGLRF